MKELKFIEPVQCIKCNMIIKPLSFDKDSYDNYNMVDGGMVSTISAPYGSCLDGNIYQIAICDKCAEKHLKQLGSYF